MDAKEFRLHVELEDSHWWFRARRDIIVDHFFRFLPKGHDKLIVEIGCGTGGNLKGLARHYSVMGIDISPEAVRHATERVDARVVQGDYRDVLRDYWQQVDGVLLADVLEHVEEDRVFLADLLAALKPGAVVVVTVPAFRFLWSRHDIALGHFRRYQRDDLRRLWQGLSVRECYLSYFNSLLFPLIALARVMMSGAPSQGRDESSLKPVNPLLNALLFAVFRMEKHILGRIGLPFGTSLIAVLEKSAADTGKS